MRSTIEGTTMTLATVWLLRAERVSRHYRMGAANDSGRG